MGTIIDIYGLVTLREDCKNPKDILYYAVLAGRARAQNASDCVPAAFEIAVPVTKTQYDSLKKQLSESTAQQPCIRFQDNLELKLGFDCLN